MGVMETVLLISEATLKSYSLINDNVDGMYLFPAIQSAQDIDLDTVIGTALNLKLQDLVKTGEINTDKYAAYRELLDQYITPYLCWQVMSTVQTAINYKMTNSGVIENQDENKTKLDFYNARLLQDQYTKYANSYALKLKNYLCTNSSKYPEYHKCINHQGEEMPRLCSIFLED
jgi:hypothetical protein